MVLVIFSIAMAVLYVVYNVAMAVTYTTDDMIAELITGKTWLGKICACAFYGLAWFLKGFKMAVVVMIK